MERPDKGLTIGNTNPLGSSLQTVVLDFIFKNIHCFVVGVGVSLCVRCSQRPEDIGFHGALISDPWKLSTVGKENQSSPV